MALLDALALVFDHIKEVMMVLWSSLSTTIRKVLLKVTPHVVFVLLPRHLLRVVVLVRASHMTVRYRVLARANSHRLSRIILRVR